MPTFLHLCQKVANMSGIIPGAGRAGTAAARPSSIATTDAMEGRIVSYVQDAWRDIQNGDNWRFMRAEYDVALTVGLAVYSDEDLGLARFGQWLPRSDYGALQGTIYTATDRSDEEVLDFQFWDTMRRRYHVGVAETGRPYTYAIDDANRVVFDRIPDLTTYRFRGIYIRSPQELADNADVPECPAKFHDAIVYLALLKLDVFDDGTPRVTYWIAEKERLVSDMRVEQTAPFIHAEPLA